MGGCDPLGVFEAPLDPGLGDRERLSGLVARWEEACPAPDDFFVGPGIGDVGVEAHEDMKMIVHHREPADGNREDIGKFLQSAFDPFFAVEWSIAEQECAADAPGEAVVPARHGHVDKVGASHRHWWVSGATGEYTQARAAGARLLCMSFPFRPHVTGRAW